MKELLPQYDVWAVLSTLPVIGLAFSEKIRKLIGKRDQWSCQEDGCDKDFRSGDMVHAAHYPEHHSKSDPLYDTEDAGRILCLQHHLEEHQNGTDLGTAKDAIAVAKLAQAIANSFGGHTYKWIREHMEKK